MWDPNPVTFSKLNSQVSKLSLIHCKRGIVVTNECLLFQIQMSEQNTLLGGGELQDNLFLILRQHSSHYHTILAINCVHA